MFSKASLASLLVAGLGLFVYSRIAILQTFLRNSPDKLPTVNNIGKYDIKFADRTRNCEDVILLETYGVAIVGCDPGRDKWNTVMGLFHTGPVQGTEIYAYDYKYSTLSDEEALKPLKIVRYRPGTDLHTLGLAFDEASSMLFVANHRHDGPHVEMFKLDLAALTLTHQHSIRHPLIRGPNSIALINDHEFYVTNDHHFLVAEHPTLHRLETYLALPLGTLVHVDISRLLKDPTATVDAAEVAQVAFANGVELLNETTLAVASTSTASIQLYTIARGVDSSVHPQLASHSRIVLPFMPDNLSKSSDGALVVAGHPHAPTLTKYVGARHTCNSPDAYAQADDAARAYCASGRAGSWAAEWTEAGGLQNLYVGTDYPTSATCVRDKQRKTGIIAGLYAKGLLVWRD